jgi:hypothetical protein
MDKLKPYLRLVQKNIDRIALVAFFLLTGLVIWFYISEKGAERTPPPEVTTTRMPAHLPDAEGNYERVIHNLSWQGELFAKRPLDENNPFIDLVRYNIFAEREPPTEAEINQEVRNQIQQAQAAFAAAQQTTDLDRKREELQQVIRLCDRVITVWRAQSGTDQQIARDLREQAQQQLNAITPPESQGH